MVEVATPAARRGLQGEVTVPGDKSISHRALLLAALAEGESRITGLGPGADVASTVECLRECGVTFEPDGRPGRPGSLTVRPPRGGLRPPPGPLDAGNSGTTARLMAGVLAGQPFRGTLTGDASLRRRPMTRVAGPLRRMGATVVASAGAASGEEETLPLVIRGRVPPGPLDAGVHRLPVASAQVKSCLLLAGLHAAGRTVVVEPAPSRDHTERLLGIFGARVDTGRGPEGAWVAVESDGHPRLHAAEIDVPGDFSSAAFWIVAALLVPGSRLRLPRVGVNPTRTGLLRVLERMGAVAGDEGGVAVSGSETGAAVAGSETGAGAGGGETAALTARGGSVGGDGEPVADLLVRGLPGPGSLRATTVQASEIPTLIDEIPVLAVAATQAAGLTVIEGAGELRHKESDRLEAVATELGRMGARVEVDGDRLAVWGPTPLRPARVSARGDHRMAMALAVAALVAAPGRPTEIVGSEACRISYPGFWDCLEELVL